MDRLLVLLVRRPFNHDDRAPEPTEPQRRRGVQVVSSARPAEEDSPPPTSMASYDTRILRKTHVPVSDTVSDTRTPRILPDTYPVSIGLFRYFQIIKINRILVGYLSDTFKP